MIPAFKLGGLIMFAAMITFKINSCCNNASFREAPTTLLTHDLCTLLRVPISLWLRCIHREFDGCFLFAPRRRRPVKARRAGALAMVIMMYMH